VAFTFIVGYLAGCLVEGGLLVGVFVGILVVGNRVGLCMGNVIGGPVC